jgi:hypothetical protein
MPIVKQVKRWFFSWRESSESKELIWSGLSLIFCILVFGWIIWGERGLAGWYQSGGLSGYFVALAACLGYFVWSLRDYRLHRAGRPTSLEVMHQETLYWQLVGRRDSRYVTGVMLALAGVFLVQFFGDEIYLFEHYAFTTDLRLWLEPWRLVTGALLHADWWHLFNNAVFFYVMAKVVSHLYGDRFMFLLLVAATMGAAILNGILSHWLPVVFKPGSGVGISGGTFKDQSERWFAIRSAWKH